MMIICSVSKLSTALMIAPPICCNTTQCNTECCLTARDLKVGAGDIAIESNFRTKQSNYFIAVQHRSTESQFEYKRLKWHCDFEGAMQHRAKQIRLLQWIWREKTEEGAGDRPDAGSDTKSHSFSCDPALLLCIAQIHFALWKNTLWNLDKCT